VPSTYLNLKIHIIFSTLHRRPVFDADIISRFHEYMGGAIRTEGAVPLKVGGVEDHVHLLVGIPSTMAVADLVREIKKTTTKFVRDDIAIKDFRWQEGYAAFTVSHERCGNVDRYIDRQAAHHRKKSFLEEIEELLRYNDMEYHPRDWE